jgi:hypothetical protein
MDPNDEMISRRLQELAAQAGPLRTADLRRRVRRRRRILGASAVFTSAGLTAGVVGVASVLSGQHPQQVAIARAQAHPPVYCGAPRRLNPILPDPQASAPADQVVLDSTAQAVDAIGGGGKDVIKGDKRPGRFSPWYGGVEISTEWRMVIVYRVPHPALDAAICDAVHNVTVELRYAVQSAIAANRLSGQIVTRIGSGHQPGFQIFEISNGLDGRVTVGVDHPPAARKALARFGPYVLVIKGHPLVLKGHPATFWSGALKSPASPRRP